MTVVSHADGTLITMLPEGVIDAQTGEALSTAIVTALGEGKTRFILNLQRVRHANSAGLEQLVGLARKITVAGCQIVLVGANQVLTDILKATRLHSRFAIFDSTEQAMRVLQGRI